MKCPECGDENPEGAKYCSKCLANLVIGAGGYPGAYPAPQQSPSEWRGTKTAPRQELVRRVQDSSRHMKLEWAVYGGILLVLLIALVLSVTIWGNKTPTEVADGFMQALNAKDSEAMKQYVYSPDGAGNEARMNDLINHLGTEGSFNNLSYSATETDYYSATVNLEGGTYSPGGTGLDVQIDPSLKLYIGLESQGGRWYVDLTRVNIFP